MSLPKHDIAAHAMTQVDTFVRNMLAPRLHYTSIMLTPKEKEIIDDWVNGKISAKEFQDRITALIISERKK